MRFRQRLGGRVALTAALVSLLCASPGLAKDLGARQALQLVDQAKASLLADDAGQARRLTLRVLADPGLSRKTQVEALLTICAADFNLGRHLEAMARCVAAEAVGGPSWRVDALRGLCHLSRGEPEAAIDDFRAGIRRNPRAVVLRRGLREALYARYHPVPATVAAYARRPVSQARR